MQRYIIPCGTTVKCGKIQLRTALINESQLKVFLGVDSSHWDFFK